MDPAKGFVTCKAMTPHILMPVHIFFILGCQMAPSMESRMHVLKFLARTLQRTVNFEEQFLIFKIPIPLLFAWSVTQYTVELQWLEHPWNHENMFETGEYRANEC